MVGQEQQGLLDTLDFKEGHDYAGKEQLANLHYLSKMELMEEKVTLVQDDKLVNQEMVNQFCLHHR